MTPKPFVDASIIQRQGQLSPLSLCSKVRCTQCKAVCEVMFIGCQKKELPMVSSLTDTHFFWFVHLSMYCLLRVVTPDVLLHNWLWYAASLPGCRQLVVTLRCMARYIPAGWLFGLRVLTFVSLSHLLPVIWQLTGCLAVTLSLFPGSLASQSCLMPPSSAVQGDGFQGF